MTTFSIIIPTIGRPTLTRTLASIREQIRLPGDEVLVMADGPSPEARQQWEAAGLRGSYLELPARVGDIGHTARNQAMRHAMGDYLLFMDDDDLYLPGAFAIVRQAIADRPGQVLLFRMQFPDGVRLWQRRVVEFGNVSTQMIVHPNRRPFATWGPHRGGDYPYIRDTIRAAGGCVWREEVICRIRG